MIRRALIEHHFTAYQAVVAIVGVGIALHILLPYTWAKSFGASASVTAAFFVGNGLTAFIQYLLRRRNSARSLD